MKEISSLVRSRNVLLNLSAIDVRSCLHELAGHLARELGLGQSAATNLESALLEREKLGGTCLGSGIAVPHAFVRGMPSSEIVLCRLAKPADFGAGDKVPVDIVALLAGPPEAQKDHIMILARMARLFHDPEWIEKVRAAETVGEVLDAVKAIEQRHC